MVEAIKKTQVVSMLLKMFMIIVEMLIHIDEMFIHMAKLKKEVSALRPSFWGH